MPNPLRFLLDLDAKLGDLPGARRHLTAIDKVLLKLDPGLKRTAAASRAFGAALGHTINMSKSAAGAFARLGTAIGGAARTGVTGLGRLRGKLNEVFESRSIKQGFRDWATNFSALAAFHGLAALARGAVSFGTAMVDTIASAERTDAVLNNLLGPSKAKRLGDLADQISGSTEFDDDDLKRFASGLLRVGFAFDKLPNAFALGADIAALTDQDPAQTLSEVGAALERLQQRGGLDDRILKNLGIGRKDFYADLGRRLGTSAEAAEKLAEAGKHGDEVFAQIVESVGKISKGAPGVLGERMGKSLSATWARFRRLPEDLFKSLKGSEASESLIAGIERVTDVLGPEGRVGKRIAGALGKALSGASDWLAKLDVDALVEDVKAFAAAVGVFADAITGLGKAVGWVGDTIGKSLGKVYVGLTDPSSGEAAAVQRTQKGIRGDMRGIGVSQYHMARGFLDWWNSEPGAAASPAPGIPAPSTNVGKLPAASTAGGRANVNVNAPVSVQVQGGATPAQTGQQVADAITDVLPSRLRRSLERTARERGGRP